VYKIRLKVGRGNELESKGRYRLQKRSGATKWLRAEAGRGLACLSDNVSFNAERPATAAVAIDSVKFFGNGK
jgi:hypothetical protein